MLTGIGVPALVPVDAAPVDGLAETTCVAPDAVVTTRVVPVVECGALIALTGVARLLTAVM
ncbi:MAG: hypothetical protein ACXU9A_23835 [Xanthobacteraceae bacterium]